MEEKLILKTEGKERQTIKKRERRVMETKREGGKLRIGGRKNIKEERREGKERL